VVRTLNPRRTLASAKVNRQPAPLLALLWIGKKKALVRYASRAFTFSADGRRF
jgi:hypothetical protein